MQQVRRHVAKPHIFSRPSPPRPTFAPAQLARLPDSTPRLRSRLVCRIRRALAHQVEPTARSLPRPHSRTRCRPCRCKQGPRPTFQTRMDQPRTRIGIQSRAQCIPQHGRRLMPRMQVTRTVRHVPCHRLTRIARRRHRLSIHQRSAHRSMRLLPRRLDRSRLLSRRRAVSHICSRRRWQGHPIRTRTAMHLHRVSRQSSTGRFRRSRRPKIRTRISTRMGPIEISSRLPPGHRTTPRSTLIRCLLQPHRHNPLPTHLCRLCRRIYANPLPHLAPLRKHLTRLQGR